MDSSGFDWSSYEFADNNDWVAKAHEVDVRESQPPDLDTTPVKRRIVAGLQFPTASEKAALPTCEPITDSITLLAGKYKRVEDVVFLDNDAFGRVNTADPQDYEIAIVPEAWRHTYLPRNDAADEPPAMKNSPIEEPRQSIDEEEAQEQAVVSGSPSASQDSMVPEAQAPAVVSGSPSASQDSMEVPEAQAPAVVSGSPSAIRTSVKTPKAHRGAELPLRDWQYIYENDYDSDDDVYDDPNDHTYRPSDEKDAEEEEVVKHKARDGSYVPPDDDEEDDDEEDEKMSKASDYNVKEFLVDGKIVEIQGEGVTEDAQYESARKDKRFKVLRSNQAIAAHCMLERLEEDGKAEEGLGDAALAPGNFKYDPKTDPKAWSMQMVTDPKPADLEQLYEPTVFQNVKTGAIWKRGSLTYEDALQWAADQEDMEAWVPIEFVQIKTGKISKTVRKKGRDGTKRAEGYDKRSAVDVVEKTVKKRRPGARQ